MAAGEIWGLGDQGTIAVLMEELEKVSYDLVPAPRIAEDMTYIHGQDNREIRVYKYLDARLTLEDFLQSLPLITEAADKPVKGQKNEKLSCI